MLPNQVEFLILGDLRKWRLQYLEESNEVVIVRQVGCLSRKIIKMEKEHALVLQFWHMDMASGIAVKINNKTTKVKSRKKTKYYEQKWMREAAWRKPWRPTQWLERSVAPCTGAGLLSVIKYSLSWWLLLISQCQGEAVEYFLQEVVRRIIFLRFIPVGHHKIVYRLVWVGRQLQRSSSPRFAYLWQPSKYKPALCSATNELNSLTLRYRYLLKSLLSFFSSVV